MAIPTPDVSGSEAPALEVQTQVEEAGTWAKKVAITVPAKEIAKIYDGVVGELAGNLRLPGFRPGKVPRAYAEKKFKDDIVKQVKSDVVERAFRAALEREKLDVVGLPDLDPEQIQVERDKDLRFDVQVEVKPTFELGNYKGLAVEQEEVEIFDEEIDQQLKAVAERFAEQSDAPADAGVQDRDIVSGVLKYTVDGQLVHTEEDARLMVMNGHTLGAWAHLGDKWLTGAKAGESRKIENVALSEGFPQEALRGKQAVLEAEVKKIQRPVSPPIDDALAAKLGQKDLATLKDRIKEELRDHLAKQVRKKARDELVEQVLKVTTFELPKRLTETYTQRVAQGGAQMLAQMGVDSDALAARKEELMQRAVKDAEAELRKFFVLDALSVKEGLKVEDEEVDEEIVKQARSRGMRAADLFERLEHEGGIEQLRQDLQTKKAMDYLEEQAEIKVVPRKKPDLTQSHEHCDHDHGHCDHDHGHEHGHDHSHEAPAPDAGGSKGS
ncbi:MAG: trigger factor [Planctomycetota bacterium]